MCINEFSNTSVNNMLINERRDTLNRIYSTGIKLNDAQVLEMAILLAFNNEGLPRDFDQKELRELLQRHAYFNEILKEGYDE